MTYSVPVKCCPLLRSQDLQIGDFCPIYDDCPGYIGYQATQLKIENTKPL